MSDSSLPTATRGRLALRPTEDADLPELVPIFTDPAVSEWWGKYDEARVRSEMAFAVTILIDGVVAGQLHCHEEREPEYPSVAFDIALGPNFRGQGFGRAAVRAAIDHYVAQGHHRFTIDPAVDNHAAIRSYEAVGFKPIGVQRSVERDPANDWRDGLLMDALAWELPPAPSFD